MGGGIYPYRRCISSFVTFSCRKIPRRDRWGDEPHHSRSCYFGRGLCDQGVDLLRIPDLGQPTSPRQTQVAGTNVTLFLVHKASDLVVHSVGVRGHDNLEPLVKSP